MKIRKIAAYILLLAICLGVVACSQAPADETETTVNAGPNETESSERDEGGDEKEETTPANNDKENDTEGKLPVIPVETDEKTEETEEIETEDPRLSLECAPVTYFDAKAIYNLTKPGIYDDVPGFFGYDEVTYIKNPEGKPYTKILAYCDLQTTAEAYISLCNSKMTVAPYFAVKYRTTTPGISMEIYTDSVNNSVVGGNVARIPIESDGEWHVEYVNLTKIREFNGETVNYFRFDFMNSTRLPVDSYIEFEYFGFFNSEEDIEMFETGKYVPVVYVDPTSGFQVSSGIVYASSIDMINGAGGSSASKFDYRGGNSASGIDKFNHNNTTLSGGKLVFSGWTVVDGGIEKFVWSIDGITWYDATLHQMGEMGNLGSAHINATQSYTGATVIDTASAIKGGGYQGNVGVSNPEDRAKGLACDLLLAANIGDKVNVRFAAIPKSAPNQLCLIAYVKNVEIVAEFDYEEETEYVETFAPDMVEPEECEEHEPSYYWYPVEDSAMENKLCLLCGEIVEVRNTAFYNSFDIIEDANGQKTTGLYGANKAFDKDGAYIVLRDSYDFVLHGWFAANGGVKDYMYSVDGGETWLVAGGSDKLTIEFGPEHIGAINTANLGIAKYDVKGRYSVSIPLRRFANEGQETTVNVLFGAKLANNESVIITIANIKNVKIPAAPKEECKNHVVISWSPIAGQLKESGVCTICDENVVRDVKFLNNIDLIEGTNNGTASTMDAPDGVDLLSRPSATIDSRAGKDIVVQGWFAVNGGVHKYVYSIDGGKTWLECGNQPNYNDATFASSQPHIDAINGANLGFSALDADVNGRYRLSCDLASKSGETVTVILGAILENNRDASPLQMLVVTVNVTGQSSGGSTTPDPEPESSIKFLKAINDLYIGDTRIHNPGGGYGGTLFTYDAKDITVTSLTVKWAGWAGVEGGFNKWVYSTDGGNTWKDTSGSVADTTDSGILNALSGAGFTNATAKGTFGSGLIADIADVTASTVDVIFAAVPNSDTSKIIPMVKIINIKLPNDCTHPGAASWTPVAGEPKESGTCTRCGETIERDITFVICVDKITYNGGVRGWAATAASSTPYVVNNVASMPIIGGKGITVEGWVGLNGGVSKYVWSIDGETWHDAGAGYYSNSGIPGAVDGYGTGISNVTSGCQFNLSLAGLCDLDAGTYTVYFGAVPANNTGVVVPIVQIENVVVQ